MRNGSRRVTPAVQIVREPDLGAGFHPGSDNERGMADDKVTIFKAFWLLHRALAASCLCWH